jgi:WD40 repeat protein
VATTNFDGTVRVWEVASGKALGSVDAGYANTVVFSPDRRMLASATWDGDVVAAQASPGFAIATGFGPPSANGGRHGFDPVLSPNGRFLVAATGDGAALWRTDGTEVARMPAHGLTVSTAAFSADSSLVGTSLGFGPAVFQPMPPFVTTVRRTSDGSRVAVIPGAADALAFSRDRRLLVAHGLYGTGHVWRVSPAAPIPALKGTVALDAGAQRAVVGDAAGLRVVHVPDGRLISKLAGARFLASAAFSPDGTRVVGAFQGHPLRVWDTATGRLVATLGPSLASSSPRFSTDGRLVFASSDSGFSVWRTSDWKVVVTRPASAPAAVSSDGAFAAIPEEGGRLAIVALRSGITTEVQTPTVAALIGATFGVGSRLVAARDANGNVQVVACEPCRSEGSLMSLARDRLAHLGGFHPRSPVVGMISVA